MSIIEINIVKSDVLKRVRLMTAYVGKKDEKVSYESAAALSSDEEFLSIHWHDACSIVTDVLKPFLIVAVDKGDTYKARCSMSSIWNACTDYTDSAKEYVVSYIVSRWMRLVKADEESKYMADAGSALDVFRKKMYAKRRPTAPAYDDENDDDDDDDDDSTPSGGGSTPSDGNSDVNAPSGGTGSSGQTAGGTTSGTADAVTQ